MADGVEFFICKPNNTLKTHYIGVEHVLFIKFIKICNRPKLLWWQAEMAYTFYYI